MSLGIVRVRSLARLRHVVKNHSKFAHMAAVSCKPAMCTNEAKELYQHYRLQTCFSTQSPIRELSDLEFEQESSSTLERLADQLEEIGDRLNVHPDFDVEYSDGVLTVKLGGDKGTYVINKQTPNKQIWFSSPTSGPKRYDYIDGEWIYSHDGVALVKLFSKELSEKLSENIEFEAA